ncbi:hypothetical protein COCOBI_pt-0100 (chloroplast) [Coccomyxa sp. Obi]|nr:hypothetical protein COCOBI_pt-0100 [Coccomyxa sp. Obi]
MGQRSVAGRGSLGWGFDGLASRRDARPSNPHPNEPLTKEGEADPIW